MKQSELFSLYIFISFIFFCIAYIITNANVISNDNIYERSLSSKAMARIYQKESKKFSNGILLEGPYSTTNNDIYYFIKIFSKNKKILDMQIWSKRAILISKIASYVSNIVNVLEEDLVIFTKEYDPKLAKHLESAFTMLQLDVISHYLEFIKSPPSKFKDTYAYFRNMSKIVHSLYDYSNKVIHNKSLKAIEIAMSEFNNVLLKRLKKSKEIYKDYKQFKLNVINN